jgi:nitrite reductase/ring-hydroxylating ferredoxin subunit
MTPPRIDGGDHRAPLEVLVIVADTCVTCPLHGWRFDLRTGARQGGDEQLTTYAVRERDGMLELRIPAEPEYAEAA